MNPFEKYASEILLLFHEDDGSLPDIYIENMTVLETKKIYSWLVEQTSTPVEHEYYDAKLDQGIILSPTEAIDKAVANQIEWMQRISIPNFEYDGVRLEGISSFSLDGSNEISFDYRKGPEWTNQAIEALFMMLCKIKNMSKNSKIFRCEQGFYESPSLDFEKILSYFHNKIEIKKC